MKKIFSAHYLSLFGKLLFLAAMLFSLAAQPTSAAPQGTVVSGNITEDTTWTLAGSPYMVYIGVIVDPGVTLTIDPGVMVQNEAGGTGSTSYTFEVQGTLIADGTLSQEIYFDPGPDGWSGISITGQPGNINTGSSMEFTVLTGGGFGGSGVGANLRLQYAVVFVDSCQFKNSPGDGILGDDAGAQGSANIYDSIFTGNGGYAVNFEDGSVNPVLENLSATDNGPSLPYGGNLVVVNDGTLHGNHTWENMGLPYLILQTIVAPDANLTIEPGVLVLAWPGNDALVVNGLLLAEGTGIQPITFHPIDLNLGWSGISIIGTEEFPGAGGSLRSVLIAKGGYTGGNCDLYVEYGNVTVTASQFGSSQGSGICLDHGSTLVMTTTQLLYNQEYAMDVIDAGALFILDELYAYGNTNNSIGIQGGTITGVHTWPKSGIDTYELFNGYITIAPTGTLNIEPGVTVRFGVTRDITIHGTLNAIGTPANPILFTGETSTPGLWAGLTFEGTPEQHAVGNLSYATIEYGGYGNSAMVSIQNADVTFTNCHLLYCTADAIRILPGLNLSASPAGALAAEPVKINWSTLTDISGYAINNGTSQAAQAAFNWWGSTTGPTADDNPGGTGSGLYGLVDYRPYLTGPNSSYIFMPLVRR